MNGEKRLTLKKRNGEELCVILRRYHYGDETGMIECFRGEYGNSYPKAEWYSKAAIVENAVKGHDIFVIALIPAGEIAGTTAFLKQEGKTHIAYEIAAQVVREKYRGYGIAKELFEYGLELLRDREYAAVYSQPVLFHDITQRLLGNLGLKAAGIMPGMFDLTVLHHSYGNGRNPKMPLGIQVKANCGTGAGRLFVPDRHKDFCEQWYREAGAAYEIAENAAGNHNKLPVKSSVFYQYDRRHKYLEIKIATIGTDLKRQLKLLFLTYPLKGGTTANVLLSINDEYAVSVYDYLVENGFFFTGIKPLCDEKEYMIMHHMGETPFYPADLKLNMEFEKIVQYIIKEKTI